MTRTMKLKWAGALAFLGFALYYAGVLAWGNPIGQIASWIGGFFGAGIE